jgi:hypothetical protein
LATEPEKERELMRGKKKKGKRKNETYFQHNGFSRDWWEDSPWLFSWRDLKELISQRNPVRRLKEKEKKIKNSVFRRLIFHQRFVRVSAGLFQSLFGYFFDSFW